MTPDGHAEVRHYERWAVEMRDDADHSIPPSERPWRVIRDTHIEADAREFYEAHKRSDLPVRLMRCQWSIPPYEMAEP